MTTYRWYTGRFRMPPACKHYHRSIASAFACYENYHGRPLMAKDKGGEPRGLSIVEDQELARLVERAEKESRRRCPDGGVCHHKCTGEYCFRISTGCEPLSIVGDVWPERAPYYAPRPGDGST